MEFVGLYDAIIIFIYSMRDNALRLVLIASRMLLTTFGYATGDSQSLPNAYALPAVKFSTTIDAWKMLQGVAPKCNIRDVTYLH
jgi:hypothetical protein